MTGPDETPPQTAPRFDHVLYGLPGEVPTVPIDKEPKTGLLRTRKRKVGAGIVAALLLSGGAGGAYAVHERNVQAEAERSQARVEASSLEVALAAEVEEARTLLEEQLDVARGIYGQSRDILAADDETRVALRAAIADAEETVRTDDSVEADEVTEASEKLTAATEAVEVAMDTEARAVLTDALSQARTVLTQSEGLVADDAVRGRLAEVIDRSQQLLDTADASPQARVDQAAELTEATRLVTEAVETYELERQPVWEEPAVAPPVQRDAVPRRDSGPGAGTGEPPSQPSPPAAGGGTSPEPSEPSPEEPSPDPEQTESPPETPPPSPPPTQEPPPAEGEE